MNKREIRDALASAFLDAELTVRVVNARSTDSIYVTASNGAMPYTVRIANHKSSRRFSAVDDYWIDTTKEHLSMYINAALKGAAMRFSVLITEYVPAVVKVEEPEQVAEKVTKASDYADKFYQDKRPGMINLEQYYLSSQGFVCAIDNNPETPKPELWNGHLPKELDDTDPWGGVKCFVLLVLILLAVYALV